MATDKKQARSINDQLADLRARSARGDVWATGALDAAGRLARHPNRGGWGDCEQARRNYADCATGDITATADEMADAIQREP